MKSLAGHMDSHAPESTVTVCTVSEASPISGLGILDFILNLGPCISFKVSDDVDVGLTST